MINEEKLKHAKDNIKEKEEEDMSLMLDHSLICHVPFQKYKQDFIFIVNNKKYLTSRIIADCLSPIISNFHYQDVILSEYSINTNIKGDFQIVLDLFNFEKRKYSRKEIEFVNEIFFHLGNDRYFKTNLKYEDSNTIDNVIQRIHDKLSLHSQISNSFSNSNSVSIHNYLEEEILFVSSHFYEISKENIERLDLSIIELILKNQKLMILNEDSLFSFILSLYLKDHSYGILFEYIEFQNLNPNSFEQFITLFDLCDLNLSIWSSICKRLVEEVQNTNNSFNNKRYFIKYSIPYNNQNFEGILHFLTKENQKTGNSNINEFIEIQASSHEVDKHNPITTIESFTHDNTFFATSNIDDQWISYHFKKEKVKLTHYQLRTYYNGTNGHHLKNWVIEISNDGEKWEEIDRQTSCPLLNGSYKSVTFPISKTVDFCQYIRLRNIGPNWVDNHRLLWKTIEFYGDLK